MHDVSRPWWIHAPRVSSVCPKIGFLLRAQSVMNSLIVYSTIKVFMHAPQLIFDISLIAVEYLTALREGKSRPHNNTRVDDTCSQKEMTF